MDLSRRNLLKSALVLGGISAVGREMVFGSLAEEAVASGRTSPISTSRRSRSMVQPHIGITASTTITIGSPATSFAR